MCMHVSYVCMCVCIYVCVCICVPVCEYVYGLPLKKKQDLQTL